MKVEELEHTWRSDGVDIHNGEYWYKCTKCGATDWIPRYGKLTDLRPIKCPAKKTKQ